MTMDHTTAVLKTLEQHHDFSSIDSSRWAPLAALPGVSEALSGVMTKTMIAHWSTRQSMYSRYWGWFDGDPLKARSQSGKKLPMYPLEINPISLVCMKHSEALFGEVAGNSTTMVGFGFVNAEGKIDDLCRIAADIVTTVWMESAGNDIQTEGALISQILGGCFYRLSYYPSINRTFPISINICLPDFVYPIWDSADKWRLLRVIQAYYITGEEAVEKYGVEPKNGERALYLEEWTERAYRILIDGRQPEIRIGNFRLPSEGNNRWNAVPFVYIPHHNRGGGFYGYSHVPPLAPLALEYNARMADRGDKIMAQALDQYWLRNASGAIKFRPVGDTLSLLDLGSAPPGSNRDPEIGVFERNTMSAAGGAEFTDDLWTLICRTSGIPPVAWGEDEGSQRSSLTLETRFWPLVSHIRRERSFWTYGLSILNRMILRMLYEIGFPGVTKEMLILKPTVEWEEVLPRERQQRVDEMVKRIAARIVSRRTAISALAQGEDIDQEMRYIQEDMELEREMGEDPLMKQEMNAVRSRSTS